MSDFTPRANLRLPGGGSTGTILPDEQVDIDVLNDNFRKIDALLGARNIPSAPSYAGSMDGDLVYARDTEFLHMFSANAGGLITPRLPGSKMFSGTRAERMAFAGAREGDMWLDSNNIGIIWRFKAGSPGTWVYSGNKCRGTEADILQTDTDGIAVPGMTAFCTDNGSDYVRGATAWSKTPRVETLTLIRGVAASGYAGPSVSVADGIATIVGRIDNGSGLTLTGSFQQVAALPAWARPAGAIIAPATATGTTVNALVQLTSDGKVNAASSSTTVTFAFSYPVA